MNALVYVNIDGPFWTIKEQKNLQKVVLEYVNILRRSSISAFIYSDKQ